MDVLEGIVLFKSMAVDSSSRRTDAWSTLSHVSQAAGSFFHDTELLEGLDTAVDLELYESSIQKVESLVSNPGELQRQFGFLPTVHELDTLPDIYKYPMEFVDLTLDALALPDSNLGSYEKLRSRLMNMTDLLRPLPSVHQNFALFAFRGYFYQEYAHLMSASYMPHSWRSALIAAQASSPVRVFSDSAVDAGGRLRAEMQKNINREFSADIIMAEFPLIASYVVSQAQNRGDLLSTAIDIRNTSRATAFRNWIAEIDLKIRNQEDVLKIGQAQEELVDLIEDLRRDFGLKKGQSQEVKLKLGIPLASLEAPVKIGAPPVGWVRRMFTRKTHLIFLRDLAKESLTVPAFIEGYQRLSS